MTEPVRGEPSFYYDAEHGHVMFACPHTERFTSLPACIWPVASVEPLTVPVLVHTRCGCNGRITAGRWVPV